MKRSPEDLVEARKQYAKRANPRLLPRSEDRICPCILAYKIAKEETEGARLDVFQIFQVLISAISFVPCRCFPFVPNAWHMRYRLVAQHGGMVVSSAQGFPIGKATTMHGMHLK
jgi:hypothetical protein